MIRILIVSTDKDSLGSLKAGLEENNVQISWAEACDTVLSRTKEEAFDLIIADEMLSDMKGLECIEKLVSSNPFLNCAAIGSLSSGDFHEASEGLGVLMQLPAKSEKKDVEKLLEHLKNILNVTQRTN